MLNGRIKDLTGVKFGFAEVIEFDSIRDQRAYWKCLCRCGKIFVTKGKLITNGDTKSCGCWNREVVSRRAKLQNTKHGQSRAAAGKPTRLYRIWKGMNTRCNNPNDHSYPDYGGRGITICNRWKDFKNFMEDMGDPPPSYSINRINNDGNYAPDNCEWASQKEQGRNTRANTYLEYAGKRQTLSAWSEEVGIRGETIACRLNRGWNMEKALTKPPGNQGRRKSK